MKLSLGKVKELVIHSSLVKDPEVSFLAEGFGNYNYLIKEKSNKLVFRIKKSDEKQFMNSLQKEYVFLKFFESEGIKFCPKALYYNKEKKYLIEEFIEGKNISQKDFSKDQIDLFAKQLHILFSLNINNFFKFCKVNNFKEITYNNPVYSLKKYGFNRFEEIRKGSIDKEVIIWIEKRLDENLKYLLKTNKFQMLGFSWGDIQSSVIINNLNQMYFYDFEHCGISNGPGLAYVKIHGRFNIKQFNYLIERYSHYSKQSKGKILENMLIEEKIVRVNDVVWAAMKWVKTNKIKFKQLTYDRIKLVEMLEN